MKLRLVIAAACGIAVAAPAYALQDPQPTAAIQASGTTPASYAWYPGDVTIAAKGTVTFSNPTGEFHDVAFDSGSPACTGLPASPADQWTGGSCRFDAPGTYTFHCHAHVYMTGTIRVVAPTPTPTPTATATPTPTAVPGATATPAPAGGSRPPAASQTTLKGAVALAKSQRGARVRGSVDVRVPGSRLEVALWAQRRSLSGGTSTKPVRIGRWTRASAPAGKVSFAVGTDAKAKSALRRRHRLSVTVGIALTPPGGHKLTHSAKSTLRAG